MSAGATTNAYTLRHTERGVTYYFVVTAQDTSGNRSKYSSEAAVTLPGVFKNRRLH